MKSEAVPKAGHIAGSQSLYWKKLIRSDADPRLLDPRRTATAIRYDAGASHGKSVVTYCRTGMQSSFTYFVAKYLGYRAAMYDGSVYEWVHAADNELVTSPSAGAHEHSATINPAICRFVGDGTMKRNFILFDIRRVFADRAFVGLAASDTPKWFRRRPVLLIRNWLSRPNGSPTISPIQIW